MKRSTDSRRHGLKQGESVSQILKVMYCDKCDVPRAEEFSFNLKRRQLGVTEKFICGRVFCRGIIGRADNWEGKRPAVAELTFTTLLIDGDTVEPIL